MRHTKMGLAMMIFLVLWLPTIACSLFGDDPEDEREETSTFKDVAPEAAVKRLAEGLAFSCAPPENSYVHRKGDIDEGYEESWRYVVRIDPDTGSFRLTHEASAHRKIPEKCYVIHAWKAQGRGEIDSTYKFNTTITLKEDITDGCQALDKSPAYEETRSDVSEWWLVSRSPRHTDEQWKQHTEGRWVIDVCTCNANAHPLTQADVKKFQNEGVCPPRVCGAMLCKEVSVP